jgi:hypothetical protein
MDSANDHDDDRGWVERAIARDLGIHRDTPPPVFGWRRPRWWLLGMPPWAGLALIPGAVLIGVLARMFPGVTERVYGRALYPLIGGGLSGLSGLIAPVSLAEVLTAAVLLAMVLWAVQKANHRVSLGMRPVGLGRGWRWRGAARALAFTGMAAMAFQVAWGLNYHRPTLAEQCGLDARLAEKPADTRELAALIDDLMRRGESLRNESQFRSHQLWDLPDDIFERAGPGWQAVAKQYPSLSPHGSVPKRPVLSPVMDMVGVSGMYWPFTGEANVNAGIPLALVSFTACHEQAHQRGIASEDEANYVAWLVCNESGDALLQYSAHFTVLLYALNALARVDPEVHEWVTDGNHNIKALSAPREDDQELSYEPREDLRGENARDEELATRLGHRLPRISGGLYSDLLKVREWQQRNAGAIRDVGRKINDTYLRANAQAGVVSYGRVVDLVIASRRPK